MRLKDILPLVMDERLAIYGKIDCGTTNSYDVELMRGNKLSMCIPEFIEWLEKLNPVVISISYCENDAFGNEHLLCIHCGDLLKAAR